MRRGHIRKVAIVRGTLRRIDTEMQKPTYAGRIVGITFAESTEIGMVDAGRATIPHGRIFNQRSGIAQRLFVERTDTTLAIDVRGQSLVGTHAAADLIAA
jgi:hypothetical protein